MFKDFYQFPLHLPTNDPDVCYRVEQDKEQRGFVVTLCYRVGGVWMMQMNKRIAVRSYEMARQEIAKGRLV